MPESEYVSVSPSASWAVNAVPTFSPEAVFSTTVRVAEAPSSNTGGLFDAGACLSDMATSTASSMFSVSGSSMVQSVA